MIRRRRVWLVTLTACIALAVGSAPADARFRGPYVALGDSYTSAPLVLMPKGKPIDCGRSTHSYPSLVARAIGTVSFRDASCGGATTSDMTEPQTASFGGRNPTQFNALRAGTRLVTVGIGGNDIGLVGIAFECGRLDLTRPSGNACARHFAGQEAGWLAEVAPRIEAVLQGIHERSPLARVLLVGYPDVLPPDGRGCWPAIPISPADARWFDWVIRQTNQMLAQVAEANGAEYVDTYTSSVGHDACKLPGRRWTEGLAPTAPAFPAHPNGLGERNMARQVLALIDPADQISPPSVLDFLPR